MAGESGSRQPGQGAASPDDWPAMRSDRRPPVLGPSDPAWRAVELAQRGRMILDVAGVDLEAAEAAHGSFHPTTWHFRNAWDEARRSWDRLRASLGAAKLTAALEELPRTVLPLGPGAGGFGPEHDGRWPLPPESAGPVLLVWIAGRTYRVHREAGTRLAPLIWRVSRLATAAAYEHEPPRSRSRSRSRSPSQSQPQSRSCATTADGDPASVDDGSYFACRLDDGSTQCDCAEWIYRVSDPDPNPTPLTPDGRPRPAPRAECKHLAALRALGWV